MDERLEKALDFSNYMITLNNQKRMILSEYKQELIYYFNGGQFTVTQTMISFVHALIANNQEEAVITDDNSTPILIEDLTSFEKELLNVYFTASNSYHAKFQKLKSSRKVEKLVDYE